MDAFDLLNPYYVVEKKDSEKYGVSGNLETEYLGIKSSINNSLEIGSEISQKRVLPPQLTEQRLCQFIATANIVWIIEDFHKVSEEEKIKISQMMKLFMDRAVESKNSKIIVLGAAEHGYEVCKFDSELNNRVAEIEVPLLTSTEIGEIITSGCKALNIEMSEKIKKEIAKYANCLATIAHQLAYNICYNKDIKITSKKLVKIEDEELKKAVEDFSSDKQDTYNQLYLDITQHRKATFENARIILDALSQFEGDNIQHHEIFEKIKEKNPSYPQGNLSVYLSKLCSPESYEVLRCNGKLYSFSDPFFKSYIRMKDRNNVN